MPLVALLAGVVLTVLPTAGSAQQTGPLQAGEGYVTRFSGTTTSGGGAVIDLRGTVGSIVDLRNPSQAPRGQHWLNEPQRNPVTAGQVGQVFGVALDDAKDPNIYLTATSAFGLHRNADNKDWMAGMWGPNAGPGTVWKIDAATGQPANFARIGVNGRRNTGAALGNIAYDKWNKQLYVSDLESGLVHRLRLSDGTDLGQFDHGMSGRTDFLDVATGQKKSLPTVAFGPATSARIEDCATPFAKTPACWNFADFRRRVWGLGVRKDAKSGEVRLYYAVWGSEGFENPAFASASAEDKHNSLWSVAIAANGDFDKTTVRREFLLPDFFTNPADVERFGYSRPVADIAFCKCTDQTIMLVSERGGVRNLGLDDENPFAYPHQSRVLRYQIDDAGKWQVQGRYDVGHYDRKNDGAPFIRANGSGGVDFGYAYGPEWRIDKSRPDQTAWMTGGTLCSPQAPCFSPDIGRAEDGSYVAGGQGIPRDAFSELLPQAATQPYPPTGAPYPATGPLQSYLFDTDINLDANNNLIAAELTRNDATKIGDIEVHQDCAGTEGEPELIEEPGDIVEPPLVDVVPEGEDLPDLEKVKTGPAQCIEGGICTFTITITNRGPGVWSGPLWELDTLPPGAILVDYRPQPEWVCTQAGNQVNCMRDWITLNPGDSVSLTIDVRLPFGVTGPVDNCIEDVWLPGWDPNDPAVILVIEQALNGLGYPVGVIDGVLDVVTINAIRTFQADNGLPVTGIPDEAVIGLLFGGSAALGGDADPANDRSCHTVDVTPLPPPPPAPAPDIEIRKIQRSAQCRPGGLCDFEIRFTNRGPGLWTGVPQFRDTLPAGANFVAATAPAICTQAGRILTCRYPRQITMGSISTRRIIITVRMPGNLRPGVQNCVSIPTGVTPGDPNPNNNSVCIPVRVPPRPAPDVQTLKIQTSGACQPGQDCTFDLWFINRGPGTWRGRPRLTDTLPSGARLRSQSAPWTCRQTGNTLACTRDAVTLRPWRAVKVSVTVRLPDNLAPDAQNCVRIVRDAATRNDPVPQNNGHCIPINQVPPAAPTQPPHVEPPHVEPLPPAAPAPTPIPVPPSQIGIEKTQLGPCKPGSSCLFEIRFINRGTTTWRGKPVVADVLPSPNITLGNWTPSAWQCRQIDRVVRCEHSGASVAPNGHLSVMLTLRLPEDYHTGAQNCAVADRPGIDPVHNTDRNCVPIDTTTPGFTPRPPTVITPGAPPTCPEGTVRRGNDCVKYTCPRGYVLRGDRCYSTKRTCPRGYVLRGNKCYRPTIRSCPPGFVRVGGVCVRINIPRGPVYRPPPRTPGHGHPE